MYARRASILIGMTAVLALAAPMASAAESQYGGTSSPPTVITPPPVAPPTTPVTAEATPAVETQPVSGADALGNAAAAVDDQSVQVIPGVALAAANVSPVARAAGAQLPFTGVGLGGLGLAGVLLVTCGCLLARSGRQFDRDAASIQA
jgi:hypothetical protein